MCIFCALILLNYPLFVCVLKLTFHISRQVSSINWGMFGKIIINASSNLKEGLHLGTKKIKWRLKYRDRRSIILHSSNVYL